MGFFSRFFRSRDKPKNYLGGLSFLFGGTTAGQTVNESTSMQVTAVYWEPREEHLVQLRRRRADSPEMGVPRRPSP